jgi:hypothetical protein
MARNNNTAKRYTKRSRLTKRSFDGNYNALAPINEVINKLAAYEDTGLTPEETKSAATLMEAMKYRQAEIQQPLERELAADGENTCRLPAGRQVCTWRLPLPTGRSKGSASAKKTEGS